MFAPPSASGSLARFVAFRAGDTWSWGEQEFCDYSPADGWALSYILNSPTSRAVLATESVSTASDGRSFSVSVPPAKTAAIPAGDYEVLAVFTNAGQRATVIQPSVTVLPDLVAATGPVDTRSFAKKTLDAIEASLAGDTSPMVQSYEIHGRKIQYTDRELLLRYRQQFRQEYNRERVASGEVQSVDFLPVRM